MGAPLVYTRGQYYINLKGRKRDRERKNKRQQKKRGGGGGEKGRTGSRQNMKL